jgi:mercuric ion transport protein
VIEALQRCNRDKPMSERSFGRGALAAGGLAAILASACCLGSLVLVALGFSGAGIGN